MTDSLAITGLGAVSAAGWGVPALLAALEAARPLPSEALPRVGTKRSIRVRRVPAANPPPALFREPRLRRASPIARYAVAAALEALGEERAAKVKAGERRLGIIFALTNGCVNYSQRFFSEVTRDPALASPILFPETVFDAPASHLAALLGSKGPCYTLVGDTAQFLAAVDLAAQWLLAREVDLCLVVGAEELDWLSSEAANFFSNQSVTSEGAGAWLLERGHGPVVLKHLTEAVAFRQERGRAASAAKMRADLPATGDGVLLADGRQGSARLDRAEAAAWEDWGGSRISPASILGDALGARLALQSVAAAAWIRAGDARQALISHVGGNQQAMGAHLVQGPNS